MTEKTSELILFLLEAKQKTYAGDGEHAPSSRPASLDLPYRRGEYFYLDTYLGGERFIGEEAVWLAGKPQWGMNYYGWLLVPEAPPGFGEFLKRALLAAPLEAPFRGPLFFKEGAFEYRCEWDGAFERFEGRETIWFAQKPVYELVFHGGTIL